VAPVLPVSATAPTELGVPLTVQVTLAPAGTASPADQAALEGLMRQAPWLTPGGSPVTAHEVPADASAEPWFLQTKLPL
ncbi:hypothetical protein ACOARS_12220, partial [Glaesserella parasuis]|uniref:hypothetical protein n=1 Tax=Glaesserella parasuis TaxID=738 RepID=UPI003B788D1A